MTLEEAARLLELSPQTLGVQIRAGRLRARRFGSSARAPYDVTPRAVEEYRRDHLGRVGRPLGAKDRSPRSR